MPAMKTHLVKVQQFGKETPKGNSKGNGRKRAKTENIDIVFKGPRKASVREEIRAASSSM